MSKVANHCPVCRGCDTSSILEFPCQLTSTSTVLGSSTTVFACRDCGHAFKVEDDALAEFMSGMYQNQIKSEVSEPVYKYNEDGPVYRDVHIARVLVELISFAPHCRVLDHFCANASALKRLKQDRPDLDVSAYDPHLPYSANWAFLDPERQVHEASKLAEEVKNGFAVVVSNFELAHRKDPVEYLQDMAACASKEGVIFVSVPDRAANAGDLLVANHLGHFSRKSLRKSFEMAGLEVDRIDTTSVNGRMLAIGHKKTSSPQPKPLIREDVDELGVILEHARFWRKYISEISLLGQIFTKTSSICIYGAGFFGQLIYNIMPYAERVNCFLDRNVKMTGKKIGTLMVRGLDQVPDGTDVILLGVNPRSVDEVKRDLSSAISVTVKVWPS